MPCGRETALNAAFRFAALRHKAKDRVGALTVYLKLAELDNNERRSNDALVQAAGLCLELGKGWLEDNQYRRFKEDYMAQCQVICKQILESGPGNATDASLIIAELLYFEVYHFTNQPLLVLQHVDDFIHKWEPTVRENPEYSKQVAAAYVWKLLSAFNTEQYDLTVAVADEIALKFSNSDMFYSSLNAPGYALVYKAEACSRLGRTAEEGQAVAELVNTNMGWYNSVGRGLHKSLKKAN